MSIETIVPSIVAIARSYGVKLKLSSLRDAISYALLDMPYSQAVFSERNGRALEIVFPPQYIRTATDRYHIKPMGLLLSFYAHVRNLKKIELTAQSVPGKITFDLSVLEGAHPAPLYFTDFGQKPQQEAYVLLDEIGMVWVQYSGILNTRTPEFSHYYRALRFDVPPAADGKALAAFLRSENGHSLLSRIHAGYTVERSGHDQVDCLTPDAVQAVEALESSLRNTPLVEVVDPRTHLFETGSLKDYWWTQPLEVAASQLAQRASNEGIVIEGEALENFRRCLAVEAIRSYRESLPLTRTIVRELANRRSISLMDYAGWLVYRGTDSIQDPAESSLDAAMRPFQLSIFDPFMSKKAIKAGAQRAKSILEGRGVSVAEGYLANAIGYLGQRPILRHLNAWSEARQMALIESQFDIEEFDRSLTAS